MEEQAFTRLFKTYYTLLFRVAYELLHDEVESHDAVHEVFATIWSKHLTIDTKTEREFLVRSVHNQCVNLIARKERDEKLRRLYPLELSATLRPDENDQRLKQIYRFIDQEMPPDTRQVLRLCFDEEKSYAEAAEELHFSVSYINKHIVRALRLLRDRFNPHRKKDD